MINDTKTVTNDFVAAISLLEKNTITVDTAINNFKSKGSAKEGATPEDVIKELRSIAKTTAELVESAMTSQEDLIQAANTVVNDIGPSIESLLFCTKGAVKTSGQKQRCGQFLIFL